MLSDWVALEYVTSLDVMFAFRNAGSRVEIELLENGAGYQEFKAKHNK